MDTAGKDGETLRQTLEAFKRQRGFMPAEGIFDGEYPEELDGLWNVYRDIRSSTPRDPMSGRLGPIPESELGWFMQNRRIRLSTWEQQALRLLDTAYRNPTADLFGEQE